MVSIRSDAKYKHEELFDWPPWVPGIFAFIALVCGVGVIVQRQGAGQGLLWPVLFAGLVLLPFTLEGVSALTGVRLALPKVLFPVPVLVGMALLLIRSTEVDFAPFVLVLLCAQMAAESEDRPIFGVLVTAASCAEMVLADIFAQHDDSFIWVIGISFGWFGGFSVQTLANQTFALKRANAELGEKAATEERQRIAREVHDVIAHSLSVTMLHVTAARMALQRGRADDALEALEEAEKQGRTSLNEVRRTVGLLGPDGSATAAPMPGVVDLPTLVADFRSAGLDARLNVHTADNELPAAAGLNLYRIVQEALTNAVKHAPGAAVDVDLDMDGSTIRLRVHNDAVNGAPPNGSGSGMGLRSMSERATLLGGELETDTSDGWTVTVVAPYPSS